MTLPSLDSLPAIVNAIHLHLPPLLFTFFSLILIIISWGFYHEALRSPQPRVPKRERTGPENKNVSDVLRVLAFLLRSTMIFLCLAEIWALFVAANLEWDQNSSGQWDWLGSLLVENLWVKEISSSGIALLMPGDGELSTKFYPGGRLPILAAIGLLVQALGGGLRVWSQRTLGRFFTWELTILRAPGTPNDMAEIGKPLVFNCVDMKLTTEGWILGKSLEPTAPVKMDRTRDTVVEHKLITCGPYTCVRHPGYSGALFLGLGQLLFGLSSSTFVNECVRLSSYSALAIPWKALEWSWVLVYVGSIGLIISRTNKEDIMLRQEFGSEWDQWARRARWKLIPFVY